jgi:hypothetical protein
MGSNLGARALLVVRFLAAWIGYDAWVVSHVVLDPNSTRAAAHALLETPAVRRGLAHDLTRDLDRKLPAAAKNPRVRPAVAAALRDPRVTSAFADTVARIRQTILSDGDGARFTVDGRALNDALHDALAPGDPRLAAQVERLPPLDVRVKADNLPHLHDPRTAADGVALLGIIAALLLITASLLLQHDRRSIARVGRRIAYLAITPLIVFAVLPPRVLAHASGDGPGIAAALLRTYGNRVLPSAVGLVIAGLAIVVGAIVWPRAGGSATQSAADAPPSDPRRAAAAPWPRSAPDQPEITEKLYL